MPYKNIRWIKLMFWDLMTDPKRKFLDQLNDEQKGLFLQLLILMGYYQNQIPNDPETIKKTLNLSEKTEKITENLNVICDVFSDGIRKSQFIKFKKFNDLHNPIGKSSGTPRDTLWDGAEKSRIEKNRIDKILSEFLSLKHIDCKENKPLLSELYRRNTRPIKKLIIMAGTDEQAIEALKWVAKWLESKGLNWTLETVVKHYDTFLSNKGKQDGGVWEAKFGESRD